MTDSEPPLKQQWKAIVEVKSGHDLTLPKNHDAFDKALDELDVCEAISRHPNGWVVFDFTLRAHDALDAMVDAVQLVGTIWEQMTLIDLPQLLDLKVTITEYTEWLDSADPGGHIRMWAEQDFSKQPLPSAQEQKDLLDKLDGKE